MEKPSSLNLDLAKDTRNFVELIESKCTSPEDSRLYSITKTFGDSRVIYEELQQSLDIIPAIIEDVSLPTGSNGSVSVRIVRPEGNLEKLPIIYYIHGGGWIIGSKHTHDRIIRTLANCVNAAVVFPNYSLSPEAKFPVALNECYDALKYLANNSFEYNLNADKIAVVGDSAGANMATVVALMAKDDENGPKIDYQALIFPLTNLDFNIDSLEDFASGPWLTKKSMENIREVYLTSDEEKTNKHVSPYLASCEELQGMPPALIITAENDPLRDDGEAYAAKLNKCGVQATSIRFNGTIHSFMILDGLKNTEATRFATSLVCNALNGVLHKS